MTKVQKIILFSLLILTFILYTLWNNKQDNKPTIIKPIKIAPLIIKDEPSLVKITKPTHPSDILLKLKIATSESQEKHKESEEEVVNKILNGLQKQVSSQTKVQEQQKKPVIVVKKVEVKIKKPKVLKVKVVKKIIKKVQVLKKVAVTQKKVLPIKRTNPINAKIVKKIEPKTIKNTPKVQKQLSRKEEVALYKSQYNNNLEVVGVSESFVIEEPANTLPDSYYFETQKSSPIDNTANVPLQYVEKLGVVDISNAYEVNFTIPD